jgi:carbonic anhydrase/acetyltransferase-like protein (isoleucine patch superfamily)
MKQIENLIARIAQRIKINLRELDFNLAPYIQNVLPLGQLAKFYAFYGITPHHPLNFHFSHSNLAGSYFLGKCRVDHSVLYKCDIRGDELKRKGDIFFFDTHKIPVYEDESIQIQDSFLIKTLVHNNSHDPESLDTFFIHDTMSMHYANIHGSPIEGCFLGSFSTVDLTTAHDCVIERFSYVQVGEMSHVHVDPGTIWIKKDNAFNFLYRYPRPILDRYVNFVPGEGPPRGIIMDFIQERKGDFKRVFSEIHLELPISIPRGASVDRFAVIKKRTRVRENVLVSQRAYIQNSFLGKGANAQENCYIVNSHLDGYDITAHGAKIIEARLEKKVFVGFNSFLRGTPECPLNIGGESIVMPHTIIDLTEPISIPPGHLVWGYISNSNDLKNHCLPLEEFSKIKSGLVMGEMLFEGNGNQFVEGLQDRIEHILEANGAYFNGRHNQGHAQQNHNISFNTIQPYPDGELEGLYPTIAILP